MPSQPPPENNPDSESAANLEPLKIELDEAVASLIEASKPLRSIENALPLGNESRELIAQSLVNINSLIRLCERLQVDLDRI